MMKWLIIFVLVLFSSSPLLAKNIFKEKNISYRANSTNPSDLLDIYYSKKDETAKDVIVFIHGGAWRSGNKDTYWWLGRNFARKNTVVVTINYPLSPEATYYEMAQNTALAVKWVYLNIKKYGGNPNRIFLMGHSAGAHLAALISMDASYYQKAGIKDPVKGVILNDAFGLDMYQYLTTAPTDKYTDTFQRTFSKNTEIWKSASPFYFKDVCKKPFQLFYGDKTYLSIKMQTPQFYNKLLQEGHKAELKELKNKKHIPMIAQMFFGSNRLYADILKFIKSS